MSRLCRKSGRLQMVLLAVFVIMGTYLGSQVYNSHELEAGNAQREESPAYVAKVNHQRNVQANYNYENDDLVYYRRETPIIWVGGVPRSGTTLMRAMLDAHPDIRCGEETRVIPRIIGMHVNMHKSEKERTRLEEAKITEEVLNDALGAYILSIIAKHGAMAPRLCNKDPFTLRSMQRILTIFPNSKFVLVVRDGRATVHSIISRHVTIKGFDITSYRGALRDWNRAISTMYEQCMHVGPGTCLPVFYEQLVLHPLPQMQRILKFLDVRWDDIVLHHETTINTTGGVSLSKRELSSDQVNKPINTDALTSWVEHLPSDVKSELREIAPMLEMLGYDIDTYPPNYGKPDPPIPYHQKELQMRGKLSASLL